ncbi:DnaJ-domain-containing protein [Thozetella sp. PMI_491]|nr:DnaJ-domain-containing protein [Thozetella sp. PMI_491]
MPLRYPPTRAAQCLGLGFHSAAAKSLPQHQARSFHTTLPRRDDGKRNHYEILNVSVDASPTDIKKSFYKLSKTHHPDHNPSDPAASQRFMRISEAYGVLSHGDKRARYDRDVLRIHSHPHAHVHARQGSYHSTNPAGGRPPSGLSKRRGTFTGPPPSFFRSGGWGAHGEKRKQAHDESTGGAAAGGSPGTGAGSGGWAGAGQWGGMGPGQDPYGHHDDVPHFDREGHERTGQAGDVRRADRASKKTHQPEDMGIAQGFFVISGILLVAVGAPLLLSGIWWNKPGSSKTKRRAAK